LSDKINEKYRELSEITEEKATGWETKYVELKNQITSLEEELEKNKILLEKKYTEREKFYDGSAQEKSFWNKQVFTAPEMLNFWFDFLDTSGELSKYSVKAIGQRTKAVKDSAITSIYFRETPNVIFVDSINENKQEDIGTFKYIQIPNMESVFSISA
jgi:uroporphyrinogen-III synthase